MKRRISVIALIIIFILWLGLSCSPGGDNSPTLASTQVPTMATHVLVLTNPQDWTPPVFPGAVLDTEIQANMTVVAATPEALDETASSCFGFSVHNAVFHAYRTDADVRDVMGFYSKEMAAQGWKRIAIHPGNSTLLHQAWQWGETGPLVAYVMVAPMEDGWTLIYLPIAESDSPQKIIEE